VIVNDQQRRTLEFIATVNRGGWRPTGREINEWRLRLDPQPARKGKLLEPEVPAVPERRVRIGGPTPFEPTFQRVLRAQQEETRRALSQFFLKATLGLDFASLRAVQVAAQTIAPLTGQYKIIPGKPGRPAVYAPGRRAEKFLAHLRRLGWVERDQRGRYAVTQLGHALLRAEASVDADAEESPVMVLAAEDELAYGQVLGVIAECGDALIVDAYLGTEQLMHILNHTNSLRFLISNKLSKARTTELSILIVTTPPQPGGALRELRRADFHDRWLIGDRNVYGLGSSLNGVSKATTTLVQMPDIAAGVIRSHAEDLWEAAEIIAQTRQDDDAADALGEGVVGEGDGKAVREVDGAFMHGTCTVRHRSRDAAERCVRKT